MYGKHFESTYTGSLFGSGALVFAVWGYVIANTRNSLVELNPVQLAAVIGGVTADQVQQTIDFFCAPDPNSRSKKEDGRRLLRKGQFLYFVTTFADYAGMRDEGARRDYMKDYMKDYRKHHVNPSVNSSKPPLAHSDTDTDTDTDKNKRERRASALPHDFGLTPERVAYASKQNVQNVQNVMEAFVNHHKAKGSLMKDWDAAWRTWVLREAKYGANQKRPQNGNYHTHKSDASILDLCKQAGINTHGKTRDELLLALQRLRPSA